MPLTPIDFTTDDSNVIRADNKPFICRPKLQTSDTAVLLVHGFTGTPWEMAPLAQHLATKGITSIAVRLPGHGTSPEDLARRSFEEWVETVSDGQLRLRNEGKHQVAVGLRTGAMVVMAAHLARRFDGLALLSPFLKVKHRLAPFAGILRHFIRYQKKATSVDESHHYYDKRPMEGIYQLNRLIQSIKDDLSTITVPTLVACTKGDNTVDPQSAIEIYRRLGSKTKVLHEFGLEVPHVLTTDENPKQAEVLALVSQFIETLKTEG